MKYEDIESAYEYATMGSLGENSAYIHFETGEIYYTSEMAGIDDLPDDFDENYEQYIQVPDKSELDLGTHLVQKFAYTCMPDEAETILEFFRRRGAYGRFKDFLEHKGKLETWYDFEKKHTKAALLKWCKENNITLDE